MKDKRDYHAYAVGLLAKLKALTEHTDETLSDIYYEYDDLMREANTISKDGRVSSAAYGCVTELSTIEFELSAKRYNDVFNHLLWDLGAFVGDTRPDEASGS